MVSFIEKTSTLHRLSAQGYKIVKITLISQAIFAQVLHGLITNFVWLLFYIQAVQMRLKLLNCELHRPFNDDL